MCNANNHPPSCTCGFGGEGHLGGGHSWVVPTGTVARSNSENEWEKRDFTFQTTCPECGSFPVYFIRHNNGSVWVDELGWPWPKHGCFDKPNDPAHVLGNLTARTEQLIRPAFITIERNNVSLDGKETVLTVRTNDNLQYLVFTHISCSDPLFQGAKLIISFEDHIILHPDYGKIRFRQMMQIGTNTIGTNNKGGGRYHLGMGDEAKEIGRQVELVFSIVNRPLTARELVVAIGKNGVVCTRKAMNSFLYNAEKEGGYSQKTIVGQSAPVWCKK